MYRRSEGFQWASPTGVRPRRRRRSPFGRSTARLCETTGWEDRMPDLLQRLGSEVLVVDGAMGTMLQRADVPAEQCHEQLNVTAPEIVLGIHHDYVLAGADCVSGNTFGGTRAKLDRYGLGDQVVEL